MCKVDGCGTRVKRDQEGRIETFGVTLGCSSLIRMTMMVVAQIDLYGAGDVLLNCLLIGI